MKPPAEASRVVRTRQGASRPSKPRSEAEGRDTSCGPPHRRRRAGPHDVKLGVIAVRAARGGPEKSVAGLDFSGFIEGCRSKEGRGGKSRGAAGPAKASGLFGSLETALAWEAARCVGEGPLRPGNSRRTKAQKSTRRSGGGRARRQAAIDRANVVTGPELTQESPLFLGRTGEPFADQLANHPNESRVRAHRLRPDHG